MVIDPGPPEQLGQRDHDSNDETQGRDEHGTSAGGRVGTSSPSVVVNFEQCVETIDAHDKHQQDADHVDRVVHEVTDQTRDRREVVEAMAREDDEQSHQVGDCLKHQVPFMYLFNFARMCRKSNLRSFGQLF